MPRWELLNKSARRRAGSSAGLPRGRSSRGHEPTAIEIEAARRALGGRRGVVGRIVARSPDGPAGARRRLVGRRLPFWRHLEACRDLASLVSAVVFATPSVLASLTVELATAVVLVVSVVLSGRPWTQCLASPLAARRSRPQGPRSLASALSIPRAAARAAVDTTCADCLSRHAALRSVAVRLFERRGWCDWRQCWRPVRNASNSSISSKLDEHDGVSIKI